MARNSCQACGQLAQVGLLICGQCQRETSKNLGDQEALRRELSTTLTRQDKLTTANDGGRSAETPLPYQTQASELLGLQRATLVGWCRLVADDYGTRLPQDTVQAMSLYLEGHMDRLRTHDAAAELVSEIRDLCRRVHRCIDYPDDKARTFVARCIDGCPGEVWLHQPHIGGQYADCTTCDQRWEPHQLNRLGKRLLNLGPRYATVSEVVEGYRISEGTIRSWIHRGRLKPREDGKVSLDRIDILNDTAA